MTYTTNDPSLTYCSIKLEHHLRGNNRVEPVTSKNMTPDSREGKVSKEELKLLFCPGGQSFKKVQLPDLYSGSPP